MVSTRKKRQSNKRLLSQLDDFDQDVIIGNTSSEREENAVVNEGTNDRDFTAGTSNNDSVVNGNAMSVKTLERCFNERIDREMSNIVDTVGDRIQNAILTAIENIVALKIELAIRSIFASSGLDATSVSANSERRERVRINASFENASENNDTLDVSNVNDETRHNIPDEVSELSVPETHFDPQAHTHHMVTGVKGRHDVLTEGSEQIHNRHHMVTGVKERHNMLAEGSEQIHNRHHMVTGAKEQIHNHHDMVARGSEEFRNGHRMVTGQTAVPPNDNQQNTEQTKVVCYYCKTPRHIIRDCRKRMRKEQEQRNDPPDQNKPSTSKSFAPCPHCQRTNHPPEKCWSGPNAANRPKRFKQEYSADNRNDGQEQGNVTHSGPSSILKNSLN